MMNLNGGIEKQNWDDLGELTLRTGHLLGRTQILFPKISDEVIEKEIERLTQTATGEETPKDAIEKTKEKLMEFISYEDFSKLDLKVAKILEVEKVENTERLLRIQIDLGSEKRQLVAGLAKAYSPEEMVGKHIVVVANLEPAVIRGVESKGMLLAASSEDNISLLILDRDIEPGSKVK